MSSNAKICWKSYFGNLIDEISYILLVVWCRDFGVNEKISNNQGKSERVLAMESFQFLENWRELTIDVSNDSTARDVSKTTACIWILLKGLSRWRTSLEVGIAHLSR